MRDLARVVVFAAVIGLAACSAVPEGSSSAFTLGYVHGCPSGWGNFDANKNQILVIDEERFASDSEYRAGWNFGHDECFAEAERYGGMGGDL